MKRPPRVCLTAFVMASLLALGARAARADTTVQIPLTGVLDSRGVTTLTNGNIVVFTLTIDGGGGDVGTGNLQNGFATQAVAMMKSPGNVANSLPDDGVFPVNTRHPEVVLHFSNAADPTSPQNHLVKPTGGTFSFPVPAATYSKLFLFFHGADGGTTVKITSTYSDATTDVTNATIPDFFNEPADPKVFDLATNLAKWSKTTTIAEAGGHRIFGVEVDPMPKTLTTVQVERGTTGYLVFWGATGIATSAVAGLPDGGAGASGGDASTDAGAGGASAAGGTSGAGGADTSGAAGVAGVAGAAGSTGAGGAGGQTTGTAGSTAAAGTSGTGSGGAAGATTGAAGSTGAGGTSTSGGCSCRMGAADRATPGARALWLVLGATSISCLGRRRRRARPRGR